MPTTGAPLWEGLFPASLTVFREDGVLDLDRTAAHISWLFDRGAHGVIVAGTTGEFIALTLEERKALTVLAVDVGAGRGSIIVNTGTYTTQESVELTEHAAEAGVDGALVVQPYFQRPGRAELLAHYRAVAQVDVPVMVYNIPANSAAEAIRPEDLGALAHEGLARGVKSTLAVPGLVDDIREKTGSGFCILYGGIGAPVEGFASGADGWVTGLLNVAMKPALPLWDGVVAGDLGAARRAWGDVRSLRDLVRRWLSQGYGDVAIYRAILEAMGREVGFSRLPLQPMTPDAKLSLHRELDTITR
ncbi:dihydrodipicolinate synthase family protein [Microbacterium saperdae]